MSRTMRVLHCPANVGSHPASLCLAERALGVESASMAYSCSAITSTADVCLNVQGKNPLGELKRQAFFWRALSRYDVFHFNFGLSFFRYPGPLSFFDNWDLPLLKALGKVVVVTYQGCDARDRYVCTREHEITPCAEPECGMPFCTREQHAVRKRSIARFAKYADHVFSVAPDVLRFLPERAEYLPFASVDISRLQPVWPEGNGRLRVVHAPSDSCVKGSGYVDAAMREIMRGNPNVEYRRVENMPREEALREYAAADVVVDQLLVGSYGTLAVEAMALGKPVLCYLRPQDMQRLPCEMRAELPIVSADPRSVRRELETVLADAALRMEQGRRGRAFVERWHDPAQIAARTVGVYERYFESANRRGFVNSVK